MNSPCSSGSGNGPRPAHRLASSVLVLLVFGTVIGSVAVIARRQLHAQVLAREGEVLQAVAALQQTLLSESAAPTGLLPEDLVWDVALQSSRLRGVLGVRLYQADGALIDAVPGALEEAPLDAATIHALTGEPPLVRFHARYPLAELFLQAEDGVAVPLLEVIVRLHEAPTPAESIVAQYWIEGETVAAALAQVDRRVALQTGVALVVGGVIIAAVLLWAFGRLHTANQLLRARAGELAQANRELAQLARTAAIGAITAHLVHGLRNPLAGLENWVAAHADADEDATDRASAVESTRRLRALIDEVLGVLHDVHEDAAFEFGSREVLEQLRPKLEPLAASRGVRLELIAPDELRLGARETNLGSLVLANLGQNAIEACSRGDRVQVMAAGSRGGVQFRIADTGPGLPEAVRRDPFKPRRSEKPDGAGIGLALSQELARHAGGELRLQPSETGTVFTLWLPALRPAAILRS